MDPDPPRTTEADLRAVTVGPVRRLDAKVTLAQPDPVWPMLFEREAARIRAALGDDARLVEHVGSTSVPGLPAKPIIDIALVVDQPADEPAYLPRLEAAGYVLRIREPDWHRHRMCKGPDTNVNLHILPVGCREVDRMLAFRDHLRTHPGSLARYLAVKQELAARDWEFVQQYADAKSEVVEAILADAGAPARPSGLAGDC